MSRNQHRRRRQRKSNAGRIGLVGALAGIAGIALVAGAIVVLRPDGDGTLDRPGSPANASVQSPPTGPALSVTTPEGYTYAVAAARAGTAADPLPQSTPPPAGRTHGYVDYVLTNRNSGPVLLDYPADLFVERGLVPADVRERCMPQPGVPDDMCTLPTTSRVIGRLGDSRPPTEDGGDALMPGRASYLVRVATQLPIDADATAADLRLYIWHVRFISDRKGIEVELP